MVLPRTLSPSLFGALALTCCSVTSAVGALDEVARPRQVLFPGAMAGADANRQATLSRAAAWQTFRARHGEWTAWWNERTATPHRASGPSIPLAGFADDSAAVDRAVRSFIAEHPDVFLDPVVETVAVQRVDGRWYARYRQILGGLPVLASDWEFRVGTNGRLFFFGADAYRDAGGALRAARIPASVAREAARRELAAEGRIESVAGGERAGLLPITRGARVEFRAVYDLRVRIAEPSATWALVVDAATGETLERRSLVCNAIDGRVRGTIHPFSPLDPQSSRDFASLRVSLDSDTSVTDSLGHYAFPASDGTLAATLRGDFVDVDRGDAADASQSLVPPGPGTYDLAWNDGNSIAPERDAYYHVTFGHRYIKHLDPGLTRLDRPVACRVNKSDGGACNAEWDGYGLGFYPGDATCQNSASTPSIVYHEYGHGISWSVFQQAANDSLAFPHNNTISEGSAELNFMFVLDDVLEGRGFYGPLMFARKDNVEARWPEDQSASEYNTMFILTGSFWDLRLDAGHDVADRLRHFALYGMPDDPDDGVALSEYFLDAVAADDDDADLSNGTPHLAALLRAFNPRGLGTNYYFHFTHTPIPDQVSGGPIPVTATIQYSGPFGALDPGSPTLLYSINGGAFISVAMTPSGPPDEYTASIPAPEGTLIRYYLRVVDTFGGVTTRPVGAPARRPYAFLVGTPVVRFADDMEINRGWTVGAPEDSATGGIWVRVDPNPTAFLDPVQTGDDHTPGAGVLCWVTGNAPVPNAPVNQNDVDGGRTSLTSPALDATGLIDPIVEYYRWYMNRVIREPDCDYWRVLLSNDGGASWVAVENTPHSENRWERFVVRIQDYLTPTANMRVRFVARDSLGNSTVEAAVDDFRLFGFTTTTDVAPPPPVPIAVLAIEGIAPNPTTGSSSIAFTLPRAGRARVRVFDTTGREVARLVDAMLGAGRYEARWNGRGIAPGLFFVRLDAAGDHRQKRIVVLR